MAYGVYDAGPLAWGCAVKNILPIIGMIVGGLLGFLLCASLIHIDKIAKLEARVHALTEMIAPNLLIGEKQ